MGGDAPAHESEAEVAAPQVEQDGSEDPAGYSGRCGKDYWAAVVGPQVGKKYTAGVHREPNDKMPWTMNF